MDFNVEKEIFVEKLLELTKTVASQQTAGNEEEVEKLMTIYRSALDLFWQDESNHALIEKMFNLCKEKDIQQALSVMTEDDLFALGEYAETFFAKGELVETSYLFQFLTLVCPGGVPHPYPYTMLGAALSGIDIKAGVQMYDFVLNIFPDNPMMLVSACDTYHADGNDARALELLKHAREVCDKHIAETPELQTIIDQIELKTKEINEPAS